MNKVYCLAYRDNVWYTYEVESGGVLTEWLKNVYYTRNDWDIYVFTGPEQRQAKIDELCDVRWGHNK